MHPFHGHIYFDLADAALAAQVRKEIAAAIPSLTYLGQLIPKPIGPHSKPMFEIHIPAAQIDSAMQIIEQKRRGLSVLIHPVQANELDAHTNSARWLGTPLALKLEVLPH
ncbi:MAG TPA: DOPA 4,5-dioxygenase family protein [Methylophilaceae bacterium]|jgi:DOPA 4,5-dioxygenase